MIPATGGIVVASAPAAPAAWLQGDPADSLYKAARGALNRSQYKQAISLFGQIRSRYPSSGYVGDAYYWEAFAYYRIGATKDLERAINLIDTQAEEYPDAATRSEAEVLATRIQGRLAQRGDAAAAERLAVAGGIVQEKGRQHDPEDEVKMAALQALMMMESEQALPVLRELVLKRDEASVELRRRAVVVLGQKRAPETEELLLDVVQNDPDPEVRTMALMFLVESKSDRAYEVLAEAARTSDDPDLQRRAVMLLGQRGDDRSRTLLRDLARQPGADPEVQQMAVATLGQTGSAEDRAFLRELYGSTTDEGVREYIVHSIANSGSPEDMQWLLERARDPSEDPTLRQQALFMAAQDESVPVATIIEIYDGVEDPDMRAHLLYALAHRKGPAATDKLMEAARSDPDPEVRQQAIIWLGQSKDPRVADFLIELINR
jgi:HEAT repeat protein